MLGRWMGKITVMKKRNFNDFKWGSFQVYVTENEAVIRGILKKTNILGTYMIIYEKKITNY